MIGVVITILISFLTVHYREYASYSEIIKINGKSELEKKFENYISENKISELEEEKENLSKQLLMRQGKPELPENIQKHPIKTEVLSKNKDLDYDSYTFEYMGKKRVITYLNLKSDGQGIYKMLYPTIDCLGKTFVSTFEGDKPKSKNECENEVRNTYLLSARNQRKAIEKINSIDKYIKDTINPLKNEVEKNGGYAQVWMAGPTYDLCSEHIAMASDKTPGVFKTKKECVDDINKKIRLVDEKNLMREKVSSYIPFAIIITLVFFIPLLLKLILLIAKMLWSFWLLFIEKTFESANRSEKKIKIDAEIKLKGSKDKE